MFQPNFAGIVVHHDYFDKLQESVDAINESYNEKEPHKGPLRFFVDGMQAPAVAAFCKSVDSMPLSELVRRLVVQDIPHRMVSVPWLPGRVYESLNQSGTELVVHMEPFDMLYTDTLVETKKITMSVDGVSAHVEKIVVVGPHIEARKVHRWLRFWFRDQNRLEHNAAAGIASRQEYGKVYIKTAGGQWYIIHKGQLLNAECTGRVHNETFIASLNVMKSVPIK